MMIGLRSLAAPTFSFTTTPARGLNRAIVGDQYAVSIQGADPGARVIVQKSHPDSSDPFGSTLGVRVAGTTDANGNYSESGALTSDWLGVWHQNWYAGNTYLGSFDLVVSPDLGVANPTTLPAYTPPPLPTPNPTSGTWQEQVLEGTTPAQIAAYNPPPIVTTGGAQPTPPASTTPVIPTPVPVATGDLIPGVPNNYLLMGAGAVFLLLALKR